MEWVSRCTCSWEELVMVKRAVRRSAMFVNAEKPRMTPGFFAGGLEVRRRKRKTADKAKKLRMATVIHFLRADGYERESLSAIMR